MNRDRKTRVLVLDADMIPSLTISRSLYRRGCLIHIGGHTAKPITEYSRSVNAFYRYPDPLATAGEFVDWLVEHIRGQQYDLIIPVTERTMVPLSKARDRFQNVKIAMPAEHSLEVALDKAQTLSLAREQGVPGPIGVTLSAIDELTGIQGDLRFPVVLKPARSIGSADGGASQLQVSYAFDESELEASCIHALKFGPVLLQEYFPGLGVGIELIARRGVIAYAFQHLRLHEVPLTGGGSSLRQSEEVMPELLAASERLIAALEWNGVAMVEFKLNPVSQEFCLMEINGRFWGSLPLAVAAGADFPSMLLDLELQDAIVPCAPYKNDVYGRLLSRDLHWYEAVLRGDTEERIAKIPQRWEIVKELRLFLSIRHRFDVQSLVDPMPGLVDLARIFGGYFARLKVLIEEQGFRFRQKRAWKTGEVSSAISRAGSMLFVCYGNINRSALADVMIRPYAEDSGIEVTSAGLHQEEGRLADPVMVDVSAQSGLDLASSRSTHVTERLIRTSDIIFVMEKSHYDKLMAVDGSIGDKVFLLGAHQNNAAWPAEIEDPYGHARERYEACFERIAGAVDNIKAVIAVNSID